MRGPARERHQFLSRARARTRNRGGVTTLHHPRGCDGRGGAWSRGAGGTSGVNALPEPDHELLKLVAERSFCPEGCDDGLTRFAQREQCGLGVTRE